MSAALDQFADQRHALHVDHPTHRPLSEGYERVGLAGEMHFASLCGQAADLAVRPDGDGGKDFTVFLGFSVDVKTARKPYNLIVEVGKPIADIVVLQRYDDATGGVTALGWEWGARLVKAPTRDFGRGVINHYIPAQELRPMDQLLGRLLRMGVGR